MIDTIRATDSAARDVTTRREVALWALVVGVALAMRLVQLDLAPLAASEAREAMGAWRAATGQGIPVRGYSPLLLTANSVLFWICGASDALARFWSAIFGSALVLIPLLFRRRLGRVGALASGIYLAFSPTALVASRQVGGTAIAAAGAMAFVGGLTRFLETDNRRWLTVGAVSLSVALTSGAAVYGLLLPLALAWILASGLGLGGRAISHRREISLLKDSAHHFLLVLTLSALALSTGLGWNPSGVGGVGGLLAGWFERFRLSDVQVAAPVTLLIVYELLGVVFGLGGLVWALRYDRHWAALLGLWTGAAGMLLAIMPGRVPTDLLWVVVPMAMLVGLAARAIISSRWPARLAPDGAYGALVLLLWAQCYLAVARYTVSGERVDLVVAATVIGLQVLLGLGFAFLLGTDPALRTAAAGTGLVLMALMVSAGWGVAYERPADPREALITRPTAVNVRDLVATMRDLSWQQTGMPTTLEFVYEAPVDSVLSWYLRDFQMARRVGRLSELHPDDVGSIVVTLGDDETAAPDALEGEYVGQDFSLERQWAPNLVGCRFWQSGCRVAIDWFLFRDGPSLPEPERWATLWRRTEPVRSD